MTANGLAGATAAVYPAVMLPTVSRLGALAVQTAWCDVLACGVLPSQRPAPVYARALSPLPALQFTQTFDKAALSLNASEEESSYCMAAR